MEESINFIDKYHKPIFIGAILICIGFIAWVLITIISLEADKSAYLSLSFAPTQATITINGEEYRTGTYEFKAGKYTGEIHCDGFEAKTIDFEVENKKVTMVANYLVNKEEGLDYFEKNAADIEALRNVTDDEEVGRFLETYDQKYSLMSKLPLDASFDNRAATGFPGQDLVSVKIKNGNMHKKCGSTLCLVIVGKTINKEKVKAVLSEKGYKMEDYEVIYEKE